MKYVEKTVQKFAVLAAVAGAALSLANPVFAENAGKDTAQVSASDAAMAKAIENAMTPGEGQKRLTPMVGTFNVRIRTWVSPTSAPVESSAVSVGTWVLDGRYVQNMLAGQVGGAPFSGIGYIAYDNVAKTYQAAWMDTGSTGITWYEGGFDGATKSATMRATVTNPLTAKPTPVELRLSIAENGDHLTEIWGQGLGTQMFKMMELRYSKTK
jgi:hypothetical protein